MTRRLAWASSILPIPVALILSAPVPGFTRTAHVSAQPSQSPASAVQKPRDQPQQKMQEMMKMHEQMMAEMNAANVKLDQLVQKMDAATGDAKVNATAAVVKELVGQHKALSDRMGQMHQQMMGGHGMMMNR
jgi:hypothetical protein